VQDERLKDRDAEVEARESFRESLGNTHRALMLADMCIQIENLDIAKVSFNVSLFLHKLLRKAFLRASSAGKANSKPNSEKQLNGLREHHANFAPALRTPRLKRKCPRGQSVGVEVIPYAKKLYVTSNTHTR